MGMGVVVSGCWLWLWGGIGVEVVVVAFGGSHSGGQISRVACPGLLWAAVRVQHQLAASHTHRLAEHSSRAQQSSAELSRVQEDELVVLE